MREEKREQVKAKSDDGDSAPDIEAIFGQADESKHDRTDSNDPVLKQVNPNTLQGQTNLTNAKQEGNNKQSQSNSVSASKPF